MADRSEALFNRREIMRLGAVGAGGLVAQSLAAPAARAGSGAESMIEVADRPLETVRIGFVGVGLQGSSHLESFLKIDGVEVRAVCDVVSSRAVRAQQMVVDAGRPRPEAYVRGPRDFERMCGRDDLDLVFVVDAVGPARADVRRGDEAGQARGHRGADGA